MAKMIPVFHSLSKSLYQIHKNSCEEVSVVQSSILYAIAELAKPSMQMVADVVGMDITTFSRQIGTLEKKKLVVRTPFEEDRRINILSLTEQGGEVVDVINNRISREMESALAFMNDFERDIIMRSMYVLEEKLRHTSSENR